MRSTPETTARLATAFRRSLIAFLSFASVCAGGSGWAKDVPLILDSVPRGARVEVKGNTHGSTPLTWNYPSTYYRAPASAFSRYLAESIIVTLYKDGFLPKTVELTHGPFLWRSLNGANWYFYYLLDQRYTIHLERIPGTESAGGGAAGANTSSGTAFHCLSRGYFVTNHHVVGESSEIKIVRRDSSCPARLQKVDKANDLAILKVSDECLVSLGVGPPLALSPSSVVAAGADVVTYGFPLPTEFGAEPQVSKGIVKSTSGLDADPRTFTISNSLQPGNSGGPLFAPAGGVVGVVTSTLNVNYLYPHYKTIPQDLNFAVKSDYVALLFHLAGIESDPLPPPAAVASQTGAEAPPPPPSLQEFITRIQPSVVRVIAGSPSGN